MIKNQKSPHNLVFTFEYVQFLQRVFRVHHLQYSEICNDHRLLQTLVGKYLFVDKTDMKFDKSDKSQNLDKSDMQRVEPEDIADIVVAGTVDIYFADNFGKHYKVNSHL